MYTGSLYGAGLPIFAVWPWIIAHKDENGNVEINPEFVAHQLGCCAQQVSEAVEYLTRPDHNSRTKDEDGRRLVKVSQFGYHVVNSEKYRAMGGSRRDYWREWRAKQRATVAQRCAQPMSTHTETETETETEEEKKPPIVPLGDGARNERAKRKTPQAGDEPETTEEQNFEKARRLYPGKKRGFRVEFANFQKRHPDWRDLLDDDGLVNCVSTLIDRKAYSPGFWPHFQTFVNQSRFEEALQPAEVRK